MPQQESIYLDTSVINFLFANDSPQFKETTIKFFSDFVKTEVYDCFITDIVLQEINRTKNEDKRLQLLDAINEYNIPLVDISNTTDIYALAKSYQDGGVIPVNKEADALHVAITVINKFNYLVSWNFQHLANVNRERRIIAINHLMGYLHPLRIINPMQLMGL